MQSLYNTVQQYVVTAPVPFSLSVLWTKTGDFEVLKYTKTNVLERGRARVFPARCDVNLSPFVAAAAVIVTTKTFHEETSQKHR